MLKLYANSSLKRNMRCQLTEVMRAPFQTVQCCGFSISMMSDTADRRKPHFPNKAWSVLQNVMIKFTGARQVRFMELTLIMARI